MKRGYLAEYFLGVAAKTLSAVETDMSRSHQHEFNGAGDLKKIFGTGRKTFAAQFLYLNDEDDEPVKDTGFLTWYDAREKHPSRSEYRLYFQTNGVSDCSAAGDVVFIGLKQDQTVTVIVAEANSRISEQLAWLFGLDVSAAFSVRDNLDDEHDRLNYVSRTILEHIGIHVEDREENYLDDMLARFGNQFPTTEEFSAYARDTLAGDINALDAPDLVLLNWVEREERLFRTFERHLVSAQIAAGFGNDVDQFFQFALSALNRRKSRAGRSLENHVEQLFIARHIQYERNKTTEHKSKPDFIFPSICAYHDVGFDTRKLTMLGVKSTCKDRWRQVLSEADRIAEKHLLTLEAGISTSQLDEMRSRRLQLVIPLEIQATYPESQQENLMSVASFIEMLEFRQRAFNF